MSSFTDALRGNGLVRAQRALAVLEVDPLRLDRERERFSHSPPPYTSYPSGTTTRSQSPDPPSEEQRCRQERRVQLGHEREASKPYDQFEHQVDEEEKRIFEASLNRTRRLPVGSDPAEMARENIKKCWVEQGIWNNKWNQFADGRWKHEEPPQIESESETDTEAEPSSPLFPSSPKQPQLKPKRLKSDDEKRRIAERRVTQAREREASRPYHQFVYQISKERERIQEESANMEGADAADINTTAYGNVKNTWTKRGIWNGRWGILPGMSWKHEEPFDEEAVPASAFLTANPLRNSSCEAGDAPTVTFNGAPLGIILECPVTNLFESGITIRDHSPVESNHRQLPDAMNTSQQGLSANVGSVELENGNAEQFPSAPNSPQGRTGKRVLRPTTGQALRSSNRNPSHKEGQPASASLGPVHSSKISKAAGQKKRGPRRLPNISEKASSGGPLLPSKSDATEPPPSPPPDRVTPRRSKRIQSAAPSVAKDPAKTSSVNPSKRAVRSKPDRKGASNLKTRSAAKPQGVSKRQPAKTTRGKVRKK